MATPQEIAQQVASAPTWNARVGLIRRIPEEFGLAQHQAVYARIAEQVYVPRLKPDFAYIHWRPDYELPAIGGDSPAAYARLIGMRSPSSRAPLRTAPSSAEYGAGCSRADGPNSQILFM